MLEGKYKAIRRKIESVGFLATIRLIIEIVINRVRYRESLLFYVDIPNYSVNSKEISPGVAGKEIRDVDELSQKDIMEIKKYAGGNCIKEFERRFKNKWRLFLAYIGKEVAGACWVIDNNSELKTKVVPLFDGDIALIDAWTIPSFRGKNVYSFLLAFIIERFRREKSGRAFGYAYEKNPAAIRGQKKVGLRYFINYESYRLLSYEIVIWKHVVHD
jgi:GNAT superfamily N-acetyltransferase